MVQPLPVGRFKWGDPNVYTLDKIKQTNGGCLLEADVDYPDDLHDKHNDLPFMCEKMKINKVEKLVPNLHNKRRYVIHVRALRQVLEHGLILKKVHRVIEFKEVTR